MKRIFVKKGYSPNLVGAPSPDLDHLDRVTRVGVLPERIPFITPRLQVAVDDPVAIGSVLFVDKRRPELAFLSPGGGAVSDIVYGPRRVIQKIVIDLDSEEATERFPTLAEDAIADADRRVLIERLCAGGLWPLIRELPYRDIAPTGAVPPAILVSLDDREPFQPRPEVYLKDAVSVFRNGIRILQRLAGEAPVYVATGPDQTAVQDLLEDVVTHLVAGAYPAGDPGVLLYHSKSSAEENRAWYVDGQDVLLLARLLTEGRYPTERIVSIGGSAADHRRHVRTRLGVPLTDLAPVPSTDGDVRFIIGGIFRGYAVPADSFLGFYETAVNLLPEGNIPGEFLGLFRPGYRKPTFSRAFSSRLHGEALITDCNVHGGDRACIACSYCIHVCPVDILPQFTYKAIYAGEVEEALEHGLLDCVECGLCSYVCPSKIDLFETLKQAKADFYAEQKKK